MATIEISGLAPLEAKVLKAVEVAQKEAVGKGFKMAIGREVQKIVGDEAYGKGFKAYIEASKTLEKLGLIVVEPRKGYVFIGIGSAKVKAK